MASVHGKVWEVQLTLLQRVKSRHFTRCSDQMPAFELDFRLSVQCVMHAHADCGVPA